MDPIPSLDEFQNGIPVARPIPPEVPPLSGFPLPEAPPTLPGTTILDPGDLPTYVGGFGEGVELLSPEDYVLEATRIGPAARGYDWGHIMDRHAPWGSTAQQRLAANPDYAYSIFNGMTEEQIKATVKRAWKTREKVKTQIEPVEGTIRIRYRSYDPETGLTLEIWQDKNSGIVTSAYPVRP